MTHSEYSNLLRSCKVLYFTDVSDNNDEGNTENDSSKAGLADAMAKILSKQLPRDKKQAILAKSKTDKEITKTRIEKKIKEGVTDEETKQHTQQQELFAAQQKRKIWEELGRVRPDPLERDKEKALQRIAQRGVVQLFNAVRRQQKIVEDKLIEAGQSEHKKAKVMETVTKGKFLDMLEEKEGIKIKKEKKSKNKIHENTIKEEPVEIKEEMIDDNDDDNEEEGRSTWSALREDYMMGAKMKDWDRQSDDSVDDNVNDTNNDIDDSDSDDG
ncbi:hypothetical protein FSP39_007028 [Pinctada imbricata]|uniref:RRP15-like protein n=1 Tax=Pinctada imbricata TaxID=66713 RepID=A0AA89BVV9_PINIB|nr:hypothetical protein FSP39_007028 [Pinctada imbricata]